jgi:hypothetical protein
MFDDGFPSGREREGERSGIFGGGCPGGGRGGVGWNWVC